MHRDFRRKLRSIALPVPLLALLFLLLDAPLASAQPKKRGAGDVPKGSATTAPSRAAAPTTTTDEEKKEEARARFEKGTALMKEEAWDAALAEFSRSREIYPTRGNTQNAAVCLHKLRRFDEALDMFEKVLTSFPLSNDDQARLEAQVRLLRERIGAIEILILEPGATVMIDARVRGTTPMSAPVRVPLGSHAVRVYKEGFSPFEERVEVAGKQTVRVDGRLTPLTRSGRLEIAEAEGGVADVLVDNLVVGKTPYRGPLSVGKHAIVLRGTGNMGTQPVVAHIRPNEVTTLTLALESLDADLRVEPTPVDAVVAVDGVAIGHGLWHGRVRSGRHRIEIAAEGFLPVRRDVTLTAQSREVVTIELERDPSSALWRKANPPRFIFELQAGGALTPSLGGDLAGSCVEPCAAGAPLGGLAQFHGGYQLGSGFAFTLDVGYVLLRQTLENRPAQLQPQGLTANDGAVDDTLLLRGLLAGGSVWFHRGRPWSWAFRLGGGVLVGTLDDSRTGRFRTNRLPTDYEVGPVAESARMTYAHVAPEVRLGYYLAPRVEVNLGLQGILLFAITDPTWQDEHVVYAGLCTDADPMRCDGEAEFGRQSLAGTVLFLPALALAVRLEL